MSKTSYIKRFGDKVAERDGGWVCHYCGCGLIPNGIPESDNTYFEHRPVYEAWSDTKIIGFVRVKKDVYRFATIDHVLPRSKGGSDELSNMVLCCRECNSLRRDLPYEGFKAMAVRS